MLIELSSHGECMAYFGFGRKLPFGGLVFCRVKLVFALSSLSDGVLIVVSTLATISAIGLCLWSDGII